MKGKNINELKIGDSASMSLTITETQIIQFAGLTGDFNPVHLDAEAAKDSFFKQRISHGMLIASLFSPVLALKLPGEGTIYLSQDLKFVKPVFINDTITATVTITELIVEKNRAILSTIATNQNGEEVITGTAVVMPPRE